MNPLTLRIATKTSASSTAGVTTLWSALQKGRVEEAKEASDGLIVDGVVIVDDAWPELCAIIGRFGPIQNLSTHDLDPTSLSPGTRAALHPEPATSDRLVLGEATTPGGETAAFGFLVSESHRTRAIFNPARFLISEDASERPS